MSDLALKSFDARFFDYVFNVNRFNRYKQRNITNSTFMEFCETAGVQWKPTHVPVVQRNEDAYAQFAKYGRPQPFIEPDALLFAKECLYKEFAPCVRNSLVLSDEAIMQDFPLATSPGWPWSALCTNKKQAYDNPVVANYVRNFIHKLLDQSGWCFFLNSVKKELRPIEKVLVGKVRVFTAGPMEFTHAGRRLCLNFNDRLMRSRTTASFVGKSKYFSGWSQLLLRLMRHKYGYEMDEKAWDASVARVYFATICDFRCEMLDPSSKQWEPALRRLYHILVHTPVVLELGEVFQKHTGNPSGSINTILDNTMVLYLVVAVAWWLCFPQRRSYQAFKQNVEMALQGDDNIFTVSQPCLHIFSGAWVASVFCTMLIESTSPTFQPRKPHEMSFLSHMWEKSGEFWYPVCDYNKALCSLAWGSSKRAVAWHYMRAAALRIEAFGMPALFDVLNRYLSFLEHNYLPELLRGVPENGKMLLTWEQCQAMVLSESTLRFLYSGFESVSARRPIPSERGILKNFVSQCYMPKFGIARIQLPSRKQLAGKRNVVVRKVKTVRRKQKGPRSLGGRSLRGPPVSVKSRGLKSAMRLRRGGAARPITNRARFSGREYLGQVSTSDTVTQGTTIYDFQMSPISLVGTRLSTYASLYEKYRFVSARIVYETACPTSTAGALCGFFDADALYVSGLGVQTIRDAAAHAGYSSWQVWENGSFTYRLLDQEAFYYCEPARAGGARNSYQATAVLMVLSPPPSNSVLGNVYFEYDIEFAFPRIGSVSDVTANAYSAGSMTYPPPPTSTTLCLLTGTGTATDWVVSPWSTTTLSRVPVAYNDTSSPSAFGFYLNAGCYASVLHIKSVATTSPWATGTLHFTVSPATSVINSIGAAEVVNVSNIQELTCETFISLSAPAWIYPELTTVSSGVPSSYAFQTQNSSNPVFWLICPLPYSAASALYLPPSSLSRVFPARRVETKEEKEEKVREPSPEPRTISAASAAASVARSFFSPLK